MRGTLPVYPSNQSALRSFVLLSDLLLQFTNTDTLLCSQNVATLPPLAYVQSSLHWVESLQYF
jgi:hypothetical protein